MTEEPFASEVTSQAPQLQESAPEGEGVDAHRDSSEAPVFLRDERSGRFVRGTGRGPGHPKHTYDDEAEEAGRQAMKWARSVLGSARGHTGKDKQVAATILAGFGRRRVADRQEQEQTISPALARVLVEAFRALPALQQRAAALPSAVEHDEEDVLDALALEDVVDGEIAGVLPARAGTG